ncbi:MAG: ABC transporter ATP-binding protein [Myxococcaceae bacterium]|nr:ABC transporter ATP-binding protein [Myxococcaceae bacterium]
MSLDIEAGDKLAVVGENGAGKSTLMNVLYGLYSPDAGTVQIRGEKVALRSPADALARGIGMVHQHFTLVPTLTVAENVVLGKEPRQGWRLDTARAEAEVAATCKKLGFALNPAQRVDGLSVGSQQKAEIVKALHRGVTTLILDEPTAVLTPQEAEAFFEVVDALAKAGNAVVLISHKLKEVLAFAHRVVVMRRGKKVLEVAAAATTAGELAEAMLGNAPVPPRPSDEKHPAGAAVMTFENVHAPGLKDISLELRAGEILGVAGVDGNGQRELAEVVTGLRRWTSGTVKLHGVVLPAWNAARARQNGVAHIPEDRLRRALVAELSEEENLALGRHTQPPFAKGPFIDFAGRRTNAERMLVEHDVRPPEPTLHAGALSGGNQQKLVVGRELEGKPKVLVAVQPTRGLDLGAVAAVQNKIRAARNAGCAVLLISLDLDEVLQLADRVVVMYGGKLNGEFLAQQCDAKQLGQRMLGAA